MTTYLHVLWDSVSTHKNEVVNVGEVNVAAATIVKVNYGVYGKISSVTASFSTLASIMP